MSTIKEGNILPRTGAASRTRSNQSAFINQKLMNVVYQMRKLYQIRKEINMISLFEHYMDVTATPKERWKIKSFRAPSKVEVGKLESSKVPSNIGMEKMGSNYTNYVKLPKSVSVEYEMVLLQRFPPSKNNGLFI